jgi:acetyltransferase-like isoleucine patch superfamily enzyme
VLSFLTGPTSPVVKRLAARLRIDRTLKRFKLALWSAQQGAALEMAFLVARLPVRKLRHAAYRLMGIELGRTALIHRGVEIRNPGRVEIGEDSVIGFDAILDGRFGIKIGRHVNVSSEAAIWTVQHDHRDPNFGSVGASVVIGDRVWLSFRCTVLPGVAVGEGAVVAAGAVVTRDVPPYAIVAGVPARVVAERSPRGLSYRLNHGTAPWFV